MGSSTGPPDGSGCARLRLLLAKLFRIFGKPQPAQGQFTPRHPLLVVDRLFRELRAFAHTLLIGIFGDHGARSDLCTPPLCPLADIRINGEPARRFPRRSNAAACCQRAGREHMASSAELASPGGTMRNHRSSPGRTGDRAMGEGGADVGPRIQAGTRGSAPPRRGAVYVDDAIWEWRGLRWAHLLAEDTDDLHRFAAALGIHRTSYQGPPRTSVPHYDLTAYERRRALAQGAIACNREQIVAVVRRMRSSGAARAAKPGS